MWRIVISGTFLAAFVAMGCGDSGANGAPDAEDTGSALEDVVADDGVTDSSGGVGDVVAPLDGSTVCISETPCVDGTDCPNGTRCNTALDEPRCQVIYCGDLGTPCSEDGLCHYGLVCHSADEGRTCADAAGEGVACADDGDCAAGLACFHDAGSGTCRVRGGLGSRCDDEHFPCDAPLVCSQLRDPPVCESSGGLGDLCGNVPWSAVAYPCDPGLTCNTLYEPPQCQPWPAPVGVRCDEARGLICDDTSWCRPDDAGAECAVKVGFGESCEADASCLGDGFCASSGAPMVCGWRTQSEAGEPCGNDADCVGQISCNTGLTQPVCQAAGSLDAGALCSADIQCPLDFECLEAQPGQRRCMGRFVQSLGEACHDDTSCTPPLQCARGACVTPRASGASCDDTEECGLELVCGPQGTCIAAPGSGERCGAADHCDVGLACRYGWCVPSFVDDDDRCVPASYAGENTQGNPCPPRSECTYDDGQYFCRPHGATANEPCVAGTCSAGLRCTDSGCTAVRDVDGLCNTTSQCRTGTLCAGRCHIEGGVADGDYCQEDAECRSGRRCLDVSTYNSRCEPFDGDIGATCGASRNCASGLVCTNGHCATVASAGEPCEHDRDCPLTLWCDPAIGVCAPASHLGDSCALRRCAPGLACNAGKESICLSVTLGVACDHADSECVAEACRLDDDASDRACLPPGGPLAPCEEDGDCDEDLRCVKSGPDIPFVGAGLCRSQGGSGAPCHEYSHCEYGYLCGDDHTCRKPTWVP